MTNCIHSLQTRNNSCFYCHNLVAHHTNWWHYKSDFCLIWITFPIKPIHWACFSIVFNNIPPSTPSSVPSSMFQLTILVAVLHCHQTYSLRPCLSAIVRALLRYLAKAGNYIVATLILTRKCIIFALIPYRHVIIAAPHFSANSLWSETRNNSCSYFQRKFLTVQDS